MHLQKWLYMVCFKYSTIHSTYESLAPEAAWLQVPFISIKLKTALPAIFMWLMVKRTGQAGLGPAPAAFTGQLPVFS